MKPGHTIRVKLDVSSQKDVEIVRSYFSRELRSLGDVELVDEGEVLTLMVVCMRELFEF